VTDMNFCPQCGALLQIVKKGVPSLRCPKCKYQKPLKQEETKQKMKVHLGKSVEIAVIDKNAASLRQQSTVKVVCLTCGHTVSETWNVEAADETIHSSITFFRCTKCGTTRREAG
jgi:DNA-directed RNA polymerase subunit M/transcription elongation factor TFIIS